MIGVTGYVQQYLNSAASASPTGSIEPVTGLPIQTGISLGLILELTNAQAKAYSNATTQLYAGAYQWVEFDPAVTSTSSLVGYAVFWKAGQQSHIVTTTASGNAPDFAGVVIDAGFGSNAPYAWIQNDGEATCLFNGTVTNGGTLAIGDVVCLKAGYGGTFDDYGADTITAAPVANVVGTALVAPTAGSASLVRINRIVPTRF